MVQSLRGENRLVDQTDERSDIRCRYEGNLHEQILLLHQLRYQRTLLGLRLLPPPWPVQ
jgi:hypothetical protein